MIISGRASNEALGTLFALAGGTTSDGINGLVIGPNYALVTGFRKFAAGESDMVFGPASLLDGTLDLAGVATNAAGLVRAKLIFHIPTKKHGKAPCPSITMNR